MRTDICVKITRNYILLGQFEKGRYINIYTTSYRSVDSTESRRAHLYKNTLLWGKKVNDGISLWNIQREKDIVRGDAL